MRVALPQIPVSVRAKDQGKPRTPELGQCFLHSTSPPLGPPPSRLFLSPVSHPGWPGCPLGVKPQAGRKARA